jgi:acyl-ACP thioesterase
VNHANSIKYLEWCLDNVAPKLLLEQQLKSFEINYLKEVSLNDTVAIGKNESEATTTFTLTANDKICCAVQLNFQ